MRLVLQWHEVRRMEGITQIIMQGDMPAQLDDAIVEELKARAEPDGLIHLPRGADSPFGAAIAFACAVDHSPAGSGSSRECDRTNGSRSCSVGSVRRSWSSFPRIMLRPPVQAASAGRQQQKNICGLS